MGPERGGVDRVRDDKSNQAGIGGLELMNDNRELANLRTLRGEGVWSPIDLELDEVVERNARGALCIRMVPIPDDLFKLGRGAGRVKCDRRIRGRDRGC